MKFLYPVLFLLTVVLTSSSAAFSSSSSEHRTENSALFLQEIKVEYLDQGDYCEGKMWVCATVTPIDTDD